MHFSLGAKIQGKIASSLYHLLICWLGFLVFIQAVKVKVLVAQSCPRLCNPMDCNLPGFTVHAILQAKILEWVAISFSRGYSQAMDQTQVSCITGRLFTV